MPEIIGIDHIYITVSDLERSAKFYDLVMGVLGFRKKKFKLNNEEHIHYFNRYFGYVIRPAHSSAAYNSYAPGLHHICMRVETMDEVQEADASLSEKGIETSGAKLYSEYANDYYAVFLKDPDGIELEITNFRQERKERFDNWE
jgi:catechol 2,3-dioxygenase-like lactoylglutathione lyase family enzyme